MSVFGESRESAGGRRGAGLCLYGMTYSIGFQGAGTARANSDPMTREVFVGLARELRLGFVEVEPRFISSDDLEADYAAFGNLAGESGLGVVCSTSVVTDRRQLEADLRRASAMGAKTMRVLISRILEGDRAAIGGRAAWQDRLEAFGDVVMSALPVAEELGLTLAVENHQDADSDDLIALCERIGSNRFGIALDTANPLAVAEEPLVFARRILPWIKHVHLKDYRVFPSESGYRLIRCALGEGVIDFPSLLGLFRDRPEVTLSIEMAALQARHIRIHEESFWDGFRPRTARSLAPVLRLVAGHAESGDWRTPWELEQDDRLAEWEMDQVRRSADYIASVLAGGPGH